MPRKSRVDYSLELAVEICNAVARGAALVEVCARPGMPAVATTYLWSRTRPDFRKLLSEARRIAGWRENQRDPGLWSPALEDEVYLRLCHGERLAAIARDPSMPTVQTFHHWMRTRPSFARAIALGRAIGCETRGERLAEARGSSFELRRMMDR